MTAPVARTKTLACAVALAVALSACRADSPASVVLIVVDTLRADFLTSYGAGADASPRIAELARDGTRVRNVVAVSPWTGPSVASIVTGHYPDEIGVRGLRHGLPDGVPTLAGILRDAGYETGAVVSNALAGPAYGHARHYESFVFEHYKSQGDGSDGAPAGRPAFTADAVTDRALDWLARAGAPFFLYVHYTDPHEPYLPPSRWREAFMAGRQEIEESLLLGKRFTRVPLGAQAIEAVRAHYRGEIGFVDHEVGRLLDGLSEDVVVVLTGDHGEEFLEHGGFLHGRSLHPEVLGVPLLFAGPGVPAGGTVEADASHIDILPTVLDLVGIEPPEGVRGHSLLREVPERVIFSILENGRQRCVAALRGAWKVESCRNGRPRLLPVGLGAAPPSPPPPGILAELTREIEKRDLLLAPPTRVVDPGTAREREEALRRLGYVE